ncbi:MAG: TetR/AcrR family transcriptional regulator [Planctomycetes bacterium]|nr:TetR/AcrR family transcriptional regulator [Planctomycetota bacterium]
MSIGRPLEFDPTVALDAALEVFWRQGYEATSMQDLLTAMGLSKSSFYQTFGGKQELFEQCLKRYSERLTAELSAGLARSQSAKKFIAAILLKIADEARSADRPRGCLVMNTAAEFGQSDRGVARRVRAGVTGFRDVFLAAIKRGIDAGEIRPTHRPEALADYIVSNISGLRTMVKAGADPRTVKRVANVVLAALD